MVLISWEYILHILLIPIWFSNSYLGSPPFSKKYDPNQISFRCVSWGFLVRICLMATFLLLPLCIPSQTTLNPPRPSKPILLNFSGKRSPNFSYYSLVRTFFTSKSSSRLNLIVASSSFFSSTLLCPCWRGCIFLTELFGGFKESLPNGCLWVFSNNCFKSSYLWYSEYHIGRSWWTAGDDQQL